MATALRRLRLTAATYPVATDPVALRRLDAAFLQVGEARRGLLIKNYATETVSVDELRAGLTRRGLDVAALEAAGRFRFAAEVDQGAERAEALRRLLAAPDAGGRSEWVDVDWVKGVDLDVALCQQQAIAGLVDAARLVVKTGVLTEVVETWPPSDQRRAERAHHGLIWIADNSTLLSERQWGQSCATVLRRRHRVLYGYMHSLSPARRAAAASSWRRTLLVAFGAQVLALMGFTLIFPFLPLYIQTLGVHGRAVPVWAGVISFGGALPLALMGPVWGSLGDRYGRKPMIIRAMGCGAVTMALLIVAPNVWILVTLLALSGLLTGVNAPLQALVTTVTPRAEMGRAMGLMLAGIFVGVALGPLAGGLLDDHLGFHGTFACGAGLLLAAALLVLVGIDERFVRPVSAPGRGLFAPFRDFRAVALSPGLLPIALVLFMAQASSTAPAPVLPLLVPHLAGLPTAHGIPQTSTAVGLILAVSGLCAALASWLAPRLLARYGYRRALVSGLALAGLLYLPAFVVGAVWQLALVRAAVGLALGAALPAAGAIIGLTTPSHQRGAAYGLTSSAESCGFAVGPLVGGSLGALLGVRAVFPVSTLVLLVVATVVLLRVREPVEVGDEDTPSTILMSAK